MKYSHSTRTSPSPAHLDRALEGEEQVQPLVAGQAGGGEAVVEVPQLLRPQGVGRVHLCHVAVVGNPPLGGSSLGRERDRGGEGGREEGGREMGR